MLLAVQYLSERIHYYYCLDMLEWALFLESLFFFLLVARVVVVVKSTVSGGPGRSDRIVRLVKQFRTDLKVRSHFLSFVVSRFLFYFFQS